MHEWKIYYQIHSFYNHKLDPEENKTNKITHLSRAPGGLTLTWIYVSSL